MKWVRSGHGMNFPFTPLIRRSHGCSCSQPSTATIEGQYVDWKALCGFRQLDIGLFFSWDLSRISIHRLYLHWWAICQKTRHHFFQSIDTTKAVSRLPLGIFCRPFCGALGKVYPSVSKVNIHIYNSRTFHASFTQNAHRKHVQTF